MIQYPQQGRTDGKQCGIKMGAAIIALEMPSTSIIVMQRKFYQGLKKIDAFSNTLHI